MWIVNAGTVCEQKYFILQCTSRGGDRKHVFSGMLMCAVLCGEFVVLFIESTRACTVLGADRVDGVGESTTK